MTPRKIAVLGANSFSGQDLVDLLLDDPDNEVLGISRSPQRGPAFIRHLRREKAGRYQYWQIDMNSALPRLLELLDAQRPGWIVNFAAQSEAKSRWPKAGRYSRPKARLVPGSMT